MASRHSASGRPRHGGGRRRGRRARGLVLSAVKRSLGAKDWGSMVEGHGGMLDRMDSLAFSAPVFFHLTHYFWA